MSGRQAGFTLVELVTVMILIGILAAFAIPRLMGSTGVATTQFRADVVSALRYAQKTSVSHRRLVCATVSASAVTLRIASSNPPTALNPTLTCNTPLASPDGAPYASRDANVVAGGLLGNLFFQPDGTIATGTGLPASTTLAAGNITITNEGPIRVDGLTGHVE